MAIEPIDFIQANELGFEVGNAIKYLCRYKKKGTPIEDLNKAVQYIQFIIDKLEKEEHARAS